jgi:hypothetical protein
MQNSLASISSVQTEVSKALLKYISAKDPNIKNVVIPKGIM